MNNYPRLLIISHNLYDNTNNIGKTLVSLLDKWPKDSIAQVFFRNDTPSFGNCNNYYCITDKDVLLSLLTLGLHKAGKQLNGGKTLSIDKSEKTLYRVGNKRVPIVSFIRDVMWSVGSWKTSEFQCWVKEYNPEIILFVPNDYVLAYDVVLYIEKSIIKTPLIPYYMDDSFYYDCNINGIDLLRRKMLRKRAKQIHEYSSMIFTICEKMSKSYERQFDIPCEAYMNSIIPNGSTIKAEHKKRIIYSYVGNLHSNRWKCLVDIGKCLADINKKNKHGIYAKLQIYSASELGEKEFSILNSISCLEYKGAIEPSQVYRVQRNSDILVHVEAFDERSRNSTRYSLSTKIPEYMNSGVCIFAYGPSDIASMEYMKDNEVAFVCSNRKELRKMLYFSIRNNEKRISYSANAIKLAKEKHDIGKNGKRFVESIINCYEMDK